MGVGSQESPRRVLHKMSPSFFHLEVRPLFPRIFLRFLPKVRGSRSPLSWLRWTIFFDDMSTRGLYSNDATLEFFGAQGGESVRATSGSFFAAVAPSRPFVSVGGPGMRSFLGLLDVSVVVKRLWGVRSVASPDGGRFRPRSGASRIAARDRKTKVPFCRKTRFPSMCVPISRFVSLRSERVRSDARVSIFFLRGPDLFDYRGERRSNERFVLFASCSPRFLLGGIETLFEFRLSEWRYPTLIRSSELIWLIPCSSHQNPIFRLSHLILCIRRARRREKTLGRSFGRVSRRRTFSSEIGRVAYRGPRSKNESSVPPKNAIPIDARPYFEIRFASFGTRSARRARFDFFLICVRRYRLPWREMVERTIRSFCISFPSFFYVLIKNFHPPVSNSCGRAGEWRRKSRVVRRSRTTFFPLYLSVSDGWSDGSFTKRILSSSRT